ncbi:MAG: hypothetical protein LC104_16835 [Bacteroidales bacterium]|nr:hypothetical protein [Bacteroidales bacterium]
MPTDAVSRRFRRLGSSLWDCGGRALLAGLVLGGSGCGGGSPTTPTEAVTVKAAENPWPITLKGLRKENDAAACRQTLTRLNTSLAMAPHVEQPASLSAEAQTQLQAVVPLTPEDRATISGTMYTPADAQYLAQSFHLADTARALDIAADRPLVQAQTAFAWVCRQVELRPWMAQEVQPQPDGQAVRVTFSPCLPPAFVLRRGSGNALERAYVFLALLQQLGLDGCLIGPPDAEQAPATRVVVNDQLPPSPFWAVGVRIGSAIHLFDPSRGQAFPAPNGTGVGTLAELQAQPDLLKPWRDDAQHPWPYSEDAVKNAIPFLAVPLTGLAPRMQTLEGKLPSEAAVRLAVNPVALRERFAQEAKVAKSPFWNPPAAPFSYTRTLVSFLPLEEGGRDTRPAERRLFTQYEIALLPPTVFALPSGLIENTADRVRFADIINRLLSAYVEAYRVAFLEPPTPREQLQRGLYSAIPVLVGRKQEFETMMQRVRNDRNQSEMTRNWVAKARTVYTQLSKARLDADSDPAAYAAAQQEVNQFWKDERIHSGALVDAAVGEAGVAEATYLIALAKSEEARRAQGRANRAAALAKTTPNDRTRDAAITAQEKATHAWQDAYDWWERYLPHAEGQERSYPGRTQHARQLADMAQQATRPGRSR